MKQAKTTMSMTFEQITPEFAIELLDRVPDYQRGRRPRRIAAMAWDVVHDHWTPTHQPIAISEAGETLDGQHRAAAVIEAEMPIWSWVCRGVPSTACRFIDTGVSRTVSEVSDVTKDQAAIVRQLLRQENSAAVPSHSAIIDMRDDFRHAIDHVMSVTQARIGQGGPRLTGTMRAAFVRASFHMSTEAFARAIHLLYRGQARVSEPGDGSILRLRDYVLSGYKVRSTRVPESRFVAYAKAESALRSFMNGVDLAILKPVESEQFPLPSETAEAAQS